MILICTLPRFSETLNQAHIADVKSIAELIEVCRKFAQEHPQRVKNGLHAIGWNQDYFTDGQPPARPA